MYVLVFLYQAADAGPESAVRAFYYLVPVGQPAQGCYAV